MKVRFWGISAGLSGLVLLMALGAGCAGLGPRRVPAEEEPGVRIREGVGEGYRGPIAVRVEFAGDLVRNIEITDHQEDEFIGLAAMEELLALILETGFTDPDAVSGATQSSRGFLEAVEHARLSP